MSKYRQFGKSERSRNHWLLKNWFARRRKFFNVLTATEQQILGYFASTEVSMRACAQEFDIGQHTMERLLANCLAKITREKKKRAALEGKADWLEGTNLHEDDYYVYKKLKDMGVNTIHALDRLIFLLETGDNEFQMDHPWSRRLLKWHRNRK